MSASGVTLKVTAAFERMPARSRVRGMDWTSKSKPFPGILVAFPNEHLELRRAGQIDDAVADLIDQRRDGQRHAGLHAHAPQALLAIAHGLVEKLYVRHRGCLFLAATASKRNRSSCISNPNRMIALQLGVADPREVAVLGLSQCLRELGLVGRQATLATT